MCPALYPPQRVAGLKLKILRDYEAQFQQNPASETGAYFHLTWLPVREVRPATGLVARCRFWDTAATEQKPGTNPDYTAGVLVSSWRDGLYSIDDAIRFRATPGVVDATIYETAKLDGRAVKVRVEQPIGIGGIAQAVAYRKLLAGFDFKPVKPTGEKPTRWRPLSVQAEGGNVWIMKGEWNAAFRNELTALPGTHDDQADAAAGAFNAIAAPVTVQTAQRFPAWQ